jgi:CheY-like chemotaxis protein
VLIDNGLTDLALPGPGSGSVGSTAPGLGTEGLVAFARQLRGDPQLKQTRLMLTSNAPRPGEGEIARSDLFDCVLVKPVPMDSLVHRLQGLGAAAPSGRDVAAPIERKQHHLRILVAEDNQTNQAVIKAMMSRLGYRIDIVGNGLEALQAVRERPYDLVLMDVMMPEMDGIAATREIRALPGKAASIPVFALTADVASDHHADFYAAGMQAVLLKPITLQALQAALSELEPRLTEHA